MSEFIDYGNCDFEGVRNSAFVDKSGLLNVLNANIGTANRFMCISRPRRFGKSFAAQMAYAYYDRSSDSRKLFEGLEISKSPDFEKHLNKYPTIYIDWNKFSNYEHKTIVREAQKTIVADLKESYDFLQETESEIQICEQWWGGGGIVATIDKKIVTQEAIDRIVKNWYEKNDSL